MSRARDISVGTFSGTLQAPTFSDGTTSVGSTYLTGGSAKAWGSAITNTAPATLSGSLNVSSFSDNATGDFTFNFSTAMANTEFAVIDGGGGGTMLSQAVPTTKVAGSQRIFGTDVAGALSDGSHMYMAIHGDLA